LVRDNAAKQEGLQMIGTRSRWSRRQLVQGLGAVGLGLLAGCGRPPWQAQPASKVYRIGYLSASSPMVETRDAFREGLAALGYVDGQNITLELRWAEAQAGQLTALATDLVNLPVDVLVVSGTRSIQAAMQATETTPIVIAQTGDPVDRGFATSLAHPGANVTGLSAISPQLSGKRLELLTAVVPDGSPIAVLGDAGSAEVSGRVERIRVAAQQLGVQLQTLSVREPTDLEPAFEAAAHASAAALIVIHNGFTSIHRAQIVERAAWQRLPAMYEWSEWTQAGGLMAYGPNRGALNRRAAYYVDRILKGARPADLPIEQPMTFDFAINLQTAQALGLTIPHHVLLQATELIQ
jgi:putative tryptophan/tyrosine transport system substrate-binding protein